MTDTTDNNTETPSAPELTGEQRRLANLQMFAPGQSGNPAGRPKGSMNRKKLFQNLLEQAALKIIADKQAQTLGEAATEIQTAGEQLAAMFLIKALEGDMSAADRILDNAFDKLTEKSEVNQTTTLREVLGNIKPSTGLPTVPPPQGAVCSPTKMPMPTKPKQQ